MEIKSIYFDPAFPERFRWDRVNIGCVFQAQEIANLIYHKLKSSDSSLVPGLREALRIMAKEVIKREKQWGQPDRPLPLSDKKKLTILQEMEAVDKAQAMLAKLSSFMERKGLYFEAYLTDLHKAIDYHRQYLEYEVISEDNSGNKAGR